MGATIYIRDNLENGNLNDCCDDLANFQYLFGNVLFKFRLDIAGEMKWVSIKGDECINYEGLCFQLLYAIGNVKLGVGFCGN